MDFVKTFLDVSGDLSQPAGEKSFHLLIEGLTTLITRLSLAFSHALNIVTIAKKPVYLIQLESFSSLLNKLRRFRILTLDGNLKKTRLFHRTCFHSFSPLDT